MSFKDNINRICNTKGVYLSHLIKEIKGSSSFTTAINNGSIPKETDLIKLAEKLDCSVADFFADEKDLATKNEVLPLDEDEEEVLKIYRTLSRRSKHEFMSMIYEFEKRAELEGDKEVSVI